MNIENLKPDTLYTMTSDLHRLFNSGGCDPCCHCCKALLPIGSQFKLSTVTELDIVQARQKEVYLKQRGTVKSIFKSIKPHEVMTCSNTSCDARHMIWNYTFDPYVRKSERPAVKDARKYGCSIVEGKIVAGL